MTPVRCRIAAPWIAVTALDGSISFAPIRDHIGVCLRCQAALVRHRRRIAQRLDPTLGSDTTLFSQRIRVLGALGGAAAVAIGLASLRRSSVG